MYMQHVMKLTNSPPWYESHVLISHEIIDIFVQDNYTWRAIDEPSRSYLRIRATDPQFHEGGAVFVAVHAFSSPSRYSISVSAVDTDSAFIQPSQSITAPTKLEGVAYVRCSICGMEVQEMWQARHEQHCKTLNYRCDVCQQVMPIAMRAKHQPLVHDHITCACGASITRAEIPVHQQSCSQRLQVCRYCDASLPAARLAEHVAACGERTQKCTLCGELVTRRCMYY